MSCCLALGALLASVVAVMFPAGAQSAAMLQAGRLVARLAAAGKCDAFSCQFKTLKLTR